MQTQRHNFLFTQSMHLLFLALFLVSCTYVPCVFAMNDCSVLSSNAKNNVTQKKVLLSLSEHGFVGEEILLHVDIPQSQMPDNAWGRVAVKSIIILEDGTTQTGQIKILEGIPETTIHFTKKGFYELTISVGYLVKST